VVNNVNEKAYNGRCAVMGLFEFIVGLSLFASLLLTLGALELNSLVSSGALTFHKYRFDKVLLIIAYAFSAGSITGCVIIGIRLMI